MCEGQEIKLFILYPEIEKMQQSQTIFIFFEES